VGNKSERDCVVPTTPSALTADKSLKAAAKEPGMDFKDLKDKEQKYISALFVSLRL
jgi:hypothetical protein